MSNNAGNSILALLIGAAIGAGVGILFAPDKGSKTKEKIKEDFDEAIDKLKHQLEDATNHLINKVENSKFDLEESFEDLVSNVSYKTEEVISFLEKKLAYLKEQNAKLQKNQMASQEN